MTTEQASEILGVSKQGTVYWARKIGVRMVNWKTRKIFKFTPEDIEAIRILKNKRKKSYYMEMIDNALNHKP